MKNKQLFEALNTLDKIEFKEFGKFVKSPYHNNRSEVIRFYDSIKKYYPNFSNENFTEEKIYSTVFPGKKYSDVQMRKVLSLTIQLFQKFIVDIKINENKLHYNLELIEALTNRKLFNLHNKKYTDYINILESSVETMEIYEYIYKVENVKRLIYKGMNSQFEKNTKSLDKIYSYFFTVILNEHLGHLINSTDYEDTINIEFFKFIINFLADSKYRAKPLINYYYLMIKLLTTKENNYFHELVNFRNNNSDKVEKEHNYNAMVILIDQCIYNIGEGKSEFRKIMFELSKKILQEDLMNNNATEPITFTNIVRNSSYLKQFDWTEKFINKYKVNLHPTQKVSIINYCLGLIEFDKGNFAKSLKLLSNINPKWFNMKNDIKKIILKCYYELDYSVELYLQIDSYRHFIYNELASWEKMNFGNKRFIKFITELNSVKINRNFRAADELKNKVEDSEYFYHKEWIILKLEEIIKKSRN